MIPSPPLKTALKRGALLAAANWPLVVIQFLAEEMRNLLLAVPVVGGVVLVTLLLGADVEDVFAGGMRQMVQTISAVFVALRANPIALGAFLAALGIVLVGGFVLTFVVKAGTVAILVTAEAQTGPIERPPLRIRAVGRANKTDIEPFLAGCQRLSRRYVRLGGCLLLVYTLTAGLLLGLLAAAYSLTVNLTLFVGWSVIAFLSISVVVVWLMIVNVLYLMTQMVIAVEDVSVRQGVVRVVAFVHECLREVIGIFGIMFLLVLVALGVSFLATLAFGLISFVPFAGVALVPLQLAAWLLRGFVVEYLGLMALGAYLTQYRHYLDGHAAAPLGTAV